MTLPIFWQGGNTCSGVADAMNARIQDLGASCSAGFFRPQTNFNSHHHLGSNNCATDAARINTQLGTSISCDQHGNFRWTGGDRHAACVADVQSVANCLRDESLCAPAPTTSAPTTPAPTTPAPTTSAPATSAPTPAPTTSSPTTVFTDDSNNACRDPQCPGRAKLRCGVRGSRQLQSGSDAKSCQL